jgi:hypothetical protein
VPHKQIDTVIRDHSDREIGWRAGSVHRQSVPGRRR